MNGKATKVVQPEKGRSYLCVVYDPNDVSNYFRGIVRVISNVFDDACLVKIIHAQGWGGEKSSKPGHCFTTDISNLRPIQQE